MEDENCNENSKEYMKVYFNVRLFWFCLERENFLFYVFYISMNFVFRFV